MPCGSDLDKTAGSSSRRVCSVCPKIVFWVAAATLPMGAACASALSLTFSRGPLCLLSSGSSFFSSLGSTLCWPPGLASSLGSDVKLLSRVQLFATLWTVVCQAPPSMEFSRQGYWSGLPFPSPGDLPDPRIEPRSPALQADSLPSEPPGKFSSLGVLLSRLNYCHES